MQYSCTIYDWPDLADTTRGWDGYIQINPETSEMSCTDLRKFYSDIKADTTGQNFTCELGEVFDVQGNITEANGNKGITNITTSDGNCLLSADGLSYTCTSRRLLMDPPLWSGTLTFESSKDICISAPNPTPVGSVEIIHNQTTSLIIFTAVAATSVQVDIKVLSNGRCP